LFRCIFKITDLYTAQIILNWYIRSKQLVVAKIRSIFLGDYWDQFVNRQVSSGRYSSASEVVRAALRMFEKEEIKKKELLKELIVGEKSGLNEDFDKNEFMKNLHSKYLKNEL
jgi:antitoxin ParD1/3/4